MLTRLLDNLVAYALRYTRSGGVLSARGFAAMRWRSRSGTPAWASRPTGSTRCSTSFVQLDNPQRDRSQGLGLGLSIVRRSALVLGHGVELASRPGRGPMFRLLLPRAVEPAAAPVPEVSTEPEDIAGLSVLVIDDEAPIRYALQGLLGAWGCDGFAAVGGADAMAGLASMSRNPDAILCDYRFVGETGVEGVDRLREALGVAVPALIVTGDVSAEQLIDIAASDLPVMHKPVNPAALRKGLSAVDTRKSR